MIVTMFLIMMLVAHAALTHPTSSRVGWEWLGWKSAPACSAASRGNVPHFPSLEPGQRAQSAMSHFNVDTSL